MNSERDRMFATSCGETLFGALDMPSYRGNTDLKRYGDLEIIGAFRFEFEAFPLTPRQAFVARRRAALGEEHRAAIEGRHDSARDRQCVWIKIAALGHKRTRRREVGVVAKRNRIAVRETEHARLIEYPPLSLAERRKKSRIIPGEGVLDGFSVAQDRIEAVIVLALAARDPFVWIIVPDKGPLWR